MVPVADLVTAGLDSDSDLDWSSGLLFSPGRMLSPVRGYPLSVHHRVVDAGCAWSLGRCGFGLTLFAKF